MAKRDWSPVQEKSEEMSLEEARAFRASLYKPEVKVLTSVEKREEFRKFWAANKAKYGRKDRTIEDVLWVHLESMKMDSPEQFADGIQHFGIKKIK